MKYAFLVAWREFVENAKTKGFWIGIFLFPVIIFCSIQVPMIIEQKATPVRHFIVVDQTGQYGTVVEAGLERANQRRLLQALTEYAQKHAHPKTTEGKPAKVDLEKMPAPDKAIEEFLDEFAESNPQALEQFSSKGGKAFFLKTIQPHLRPGAPEFKDPRARFHRVPLPAGISSNASIATLAQELRPYLRDDQRIEVDGKRVNLYAAVFIPADVDKKIIRPSLMPSLPGKKSGIEYWSSNLADENLRNEIERAINGEVRRREYIARGMDAAAVRQVERTHVPFIKLNPKKEEGMEEVSMADVIRQWAPSGFVYALWIAIFSIAQMLLANTIEEKSNRIIEVLLSSVTPGELMMGKLAGIAATGLVTLASWMLALVGILAWKSGPESEFASQLLTVIKTSNLLPAFAVYFLFGYLLYAGLILAIGSVCNTLKESQNFMGVIMLILMVPLMTMMFIPKDPNGALATFLSWIPLYTPFVMMNRATADPPMFEVVGTMILLILSTALVLWLSGKIFRIGILRSGQPPKLAELIRWIRG